MRHFAVDVLFPDHFCQIGQYLTEVAIASSYPPGTYRNGDHRYGRRLIIWWDQWADGLAGEGFESRQEADHIATLQTLEAIRTALRTPADEMLKLEVWLRWNPVDRRELRLWSSSTGTFSSEEILRSTPIDRRSDMFTVQTFRSGQPRHFPGDGESMPKTNRWRSYLAVPLQLTAQREITAGTVLLASTVEGDVGSLHRNKLDRHRLAIGLMNQLGLNLARDG